MHVMHLLKALTMAALLIIAAAANAEVPVPKPIHGEGQCVEPVDDMRKLSLIHI